VKKFSPSRSAIVTTFLIFAGTGCGEGPADPAVATTITANSPATATAVAGSNVSPAPSVIIRDQNGTPFSGATVTFEVVAGGGSVTGGSIVTDSTGIATVGGWTLGRAAGQNSLTASSGSLSVTFTATGTVGPTALLTITAGNNQSAAVGSAVPVPPAVRVQDANGNAKAGVTVTFSVGAGDGSVTGAAATSNADGIASVGSWTLGPNPGANTLIAAADGAPSVTFSATSGSRCAVRTTHTLGSTSSGTLEAIDCAFSDGSRVDYFSTVLPQANAYLFRQTASFDTYLDLSLADGTVIAENDDVTSSDPNSAIKALLPAGTYLLGASSFEPGVTGNYTISSQVTSADNVNCELVFVVRNVSTTQNVAATDCLWTQPPAAPIYGDGFFILLRAGQSIAVEMNSSTVDAYLELLRLDGTLVTENNNRDESTTNARITFTAAQTDYYAIVARTAVASQTGAYTLNISDGQGQQLLSESAGKTTRPAKPRTKKPLAAGIAAMRR
jgi:hypothetical protein